jgi:hypothetical protein
LWVPQVDPSSRLDPVDEDVVLTMALTHGGTLQPLVAFMGGVLGQEVCKVRDLYIDNL